MKNVERAPSLVDGVIAELRQEIAQGVWQLGDKIPSETRLAEMLQVSRLSVREAVRVLVHAGLLTTRQGHGTFVTATDEAQVALRRRLDEAGATDVMDVRRGLDLVAARLAATRRTDEDLERLREALDRRAAASGKADVEAFADADVDFHLRIAEAAHNSVLQDLYQGMSDALRDSIKVDQCMEHTIARNDTSHEELYEAVRHGDPTTATAVVLTILDQQERDDRD
ncbi:FadR/GntR family transcriptional regulator [Streptomyces cavernicola]|uniref:FadR/GntR family transcriptional regulator n=1 Tax=Streptomyces cavernicola TaxID=3043613 RepID=A0ABT6S7Z7_9ACTN|nr:FadR/GntR family transcriptional regulator [Streptomyces sp. B-S-A6]MDI3404224.1 FadR/GntR family transcriptional regulator [Streptomyces sp. B-S-A6]